MEIKFSQSRRQFIKKSAILIGGLNLYACSGASDTPPATTPPPPENDNALELAPTILTQPNDQSVITGDDATFQIITGGIEPKSYQWQRDGIDINGANNATYTLSSTELADDNAIFRVQVSNDNGTTLSAAATLSVNPIPIAPAITLEPTDTTILIGSSATFQVQASGTTLSYQWQKNGVDISDATQPTYSLIPASLLENGDQYSVKITNQIGSIDSRTAILNITSIGTTIDSTTILISSTQITIDEI